MATPERFRDSGNGLTNAVEVTHINADHAHARELVGLECSAANHSADSLGVAGQNVRDVVNGDVMSW